jgi:L-seryl-tRNA(Ser) seleniumtransferase
MISMPLSEIERRARTWAGALGEPAQVVDGESMVGGGSLPGSTLPTRLVAIGGPGKKKALSLAQTLAQRLRSQEPPIIGRISGDVLLLDPRTVFPEEDEVVLKALKGLTAVLKLSHN